MQFLWTTFLILFCWLLLSLLLAVPNVAWCMIASVCEHELAGVYTGPGVRRPGFHQSNIPLRPFWEEPGYRPPERPRYDPAYGRQSLPVPPPAGLSFGGGVPPVLAKANESLVAQFGIGRSEPFYYVFNLTSYGRSSVMCIPPTVEVKTPASRQNGLIFFLWLSL